MAKAEWNGVVLAEERDPSKLVNVEGNVYFPPDSVNFDLLSKTSHTTVCGWKGTSSYYSAQAGGQTNENCAWVYEEPKDAAKEIKGRSVFFLNSWRDVAMLGDDLRNYSNQSPNEMTEPDSSGPSVVSLFHV
jgi:uncharacterized protein (DUF427 family)